MSESPKANLGTSPTFGQGEISHKSRADIVVFPLMYGIIGAGIGSRTMVCEDHDLSLWIFFSRYSPPLDSITPGLYDAVRGGY